MQSEVDSAVDMLQQLKEEFGNLLTFPQWEQLKLSSRPSSVAFSGHFGPRGSLSVWWRLEHPGFAQVSGVVGKGPWAR